MVSAAIADFSSKYPAPRRTTQTPALSVGELITRVAEATGILIGEVESFATLLSRRPDTDLCFWRAWYFGRIPWSREAVSPASLLASANLQFVFDGTLA
jgi:hypothetical protein